MNLFDDCGVGEAGGGGGVCAGIGGDLGPLTVRFTPTCTGDLVLLQNLVVSAGTHSPSRDGKAKGTAAPIIHAACVVTWRNQKIKTRGLALLNEIHFYSRLEQC